MSDDQQQKKPVIDWRQVYVCNGLNMELFDKINAGIVVAETLKTEYELNES